MVFGIWLNITICNNTDLWPRGHSYSKPMNTLTVTLLVSTASSVPRRLARLAAFSTMLGHFSESSSVVILVRGISQGSRNLELDMKPGWVARPEYILYLNETEYIWFSFKFYYS